MIKVPYNLFILELKKYQKYYNCYSHNLKNITFIKNCSAYAWLYLKLKTVNTMFLVSLSNSNKNQKIHR